MIFGLILGFLGAWAVMFFILDFLGDMGIVKIKQENFKTTSFIVTLVVFLSLLFAGVFS